ncbi:hypothetical protein EV184_103227 [Sinorhizobium americanum]|uniref:Uncharacterized protein n=1 Tax=Sinorhizobium americanum TaxID=194963 RepID=A0A4R2C405_9HYPH|nr:hypothetical protein EV184_103227 [Sinorhizobium americanum]
MSVTCSTPLRWSERNKRGPTTKQACRPMAPAGTLFPAQRYPGIVNNYRDSEMKGIVLWLMGVPLIVIVLLYMFVF